MDRPSRVSLLMLGAVLACGLSMSIAVIMFAPLLLEVRQEPLPSSYSRAVPVLPARDVALKTPNTNGLAHLDGWIMLDFDAGNTVAPARSIRF